MTPTSPGPSIVPSTLTSSTASYSPAPAPSIDCSNTIKKIPGQCGVPGCAYYLAGNSGICSTDFCKCGGVSAPFLTRTVSGTTSKDCQYTTKPTINACPPSTASVIDLPSPPSQTLSPTTTYIPPLVLPTGPSCIPCPTPGAAHAADAHCPDWYPDWVEINSFCSCCS